MDAFVIEGGRRLAGELGINGSKNSALPLMAAALLTDSPITLRGVPDLADIANMGRLLEELGCAGSDGAAEPGESEGGVLQLQTEVSGDPERSHARYEIVRTMRASICVLGPLLARRGHARVSMPGGCAIGDRPVDLHLRGLEALGARITLQGGDIVATAPGGRLVGAPVFMGGAFGSTVLGTANVMSAATLARGTTVIECAACEPEVVDLANLLNAMGARVHGAGSPRITVEGVDELGGADHAVIPDRIEAATYMCAAAITNGELVLRNCPLDAMMAVTNLLGGVGVHVEELEGEGRGRLAPSVGERGKEQAGGLHRCVDSGEQAGGLHHCDPMRATVRVTCDRVLRPVEVTTQPHPGFPTDVQAQLMSLLCLADGISVITEKIFPDRFLHVPELSRMGARLYRRGSTVIIQGTKRLLGAPVMASDLRASASLVLAGLAAEGTTVINRVYHLDRGYERMEERLVGLGARIERVADRELAAAG
jgi:UDP-N-acetylglucosamine 1-carboxyvinyltransferase